jgi:hypothetical protein
MVGCGGGTYLGTGDFSPTGDDTGSTTATMTPGTDASSGVVDTTSGDDGSTLSGDDATTVSDATTGPTTVSDATAGGDASDVGTDATTTTTGASDSGATGTDATATDSGAVASDAATDGTSCTSGDATGAGTPGEVSCYDTGSKMTVMCSTKSGCQGEWLGGWGWSCNETIAERTYSCDDISDCPCGQRCCVTRDLAGTDNGSQCQTDCGGNPQLCLVDAECKPGFKCKKYTPSDYSGYFGACQ